MQGRVLDRLPFTCSPKATLVEMWHVHLECLVPPFPRNSQLCALSTPSLRETYTDFLIFSKNEDNKNQPLWGYSANQAKKNMSSTWDGINKKCFDSLSIQSFNFLLIIERQTAVLLCSRFKGRQRSEFWIAPIYFCAGRALVPSMWTSIFLRRQPARKGPYWAIVCWSWEWRLSDRCWWRA